MQVKQDYLTRAQEAPRETLNTILADYSSPMVRNLEAVYHPSPLRYIDVNLPPPSSTLGRSGRRLQDLLEPHEQYYLKQSAAAGSSTGPTHYLHGGGRGGDALGAMGEPSWLDRTLQQENSKIAAGIGLRNGDLLGELSTAAAGALPGMWSSSPNRARSLPPDKAIRDSMMVCESTFIFPKGFKPQSRQQEGEAGAGVGAEDREGLDEQDWGQELGQETVLVPTSKTRETISAPGAFGLPSGSKGRKGTPFLRGGLQMLSFGFLAMLSR